MLHWKKIDDELFSIPYGSHVMVYYKDQKYTYDIRLCLTNLFDSAEAWKHSIMNCYKDKIPTHYIQLEFPDKPENC